MKTTLLIAASLMIASAAHAGNNFWFNADGTKSAGAKAFTDRGPPCVGCVPFRDLRAPDYQSRTVIQSDYGTSVYNYRSYSR